MNPQIVIIPADSIHVGRRQRTDDPATQKHISELSQEIDSNGLIHAIAINHEHELVAGWCRLNAVRLLDKPYKYASADIGKGFIPCVVVHQDTEREQFRLELMENLRRKNLSPLDQALAINALHKMYEGENVDWTEEKTGQKLDQLRGEIRGPRVGHKEVADSILLSRFVDDPDIAKSKSRGEAVALARRKLEQEFSEGLGMLSEGEHKDFEIIEGDLKYQLKQLPEASFAGVIVDPPYGVDADQFGEQTMRTGHQYEDTPENALSLAEDILTECFRVCSENAHLYMFCDIRFFATLSVLARQQGWMTFSTPLLWHKKNIGHAPWPGYFSRRYECILFAMKGDRKLKVSRSDVFEYSVPVDRIHAAQKPQELYEDFMNLSFFPGEKVLDPCAGSGTIFRAAKKMGLQATGIELDPQYAAICKHVIGGL